MGIGFCTFHVTFFGLFQADDMQTPPHYLRSGQKKIAYVLDDISKQNFRQHFFFNKFIFCFKSSETYTKKCQQNRSREKYVGGVPPPIKHPVRRRLRQRRSKDFTRFCVTVNFEYKIDHNSKNKNIKNRKNKF